MKKEKKRGIVCVNRLIMMKRKSNKFYVKNPEMLNKSDLHEARKYRVKDGYQMSPVTMNFIPHCLLLCYLCILCEKQCDYMYVHLLSCFFCQKYVQTLISDTLHTLGWTDEGSHLEKLVSLFSSFLFNFCFGLSLHTSGNEYKCIENQWGNVLANSLPNRK